MSTTVEVHIGTEFGAKDSELSNLDLTRRAAHFANAISYSCSFDNINELPKDSPYFLKMRQYILRDCANLIVYLMQISMNVCEEQPPSTYLVEIEDNELGNKLGNLAPNTWSLFNHVGSVRRAFWVLNDNDIRRETLQKEIRDAIYQVCVIAAELEEDDLEPYIREVLSK